MIREHYSYFLCDSSHNKQVINILERTPIKGWVDLLFTARPSYFDFLKVVGKKYFVVGVKNSGGTLVGMVSIIVQERYIHEQVKRVGYLSNLRILEEHRGKGLILGGFRYIKNLLPKFEVDTFITAISEDNERAVQSLTKRDDYPTFYPLGTIETKVTTGFAFHDKNAASQYSTRLLRENDLAKALDFLNKQGSRKLFYPVYKVGEMRRLGIGNFLLVLENDDIVGICAVWDQSTTRQIIIVGYSFPLSGLRPFANFLLKRAGYPLLPTRGSMLHFKFISHIAVRDDNPEIFMKMLESLGNYYPESSVYAIGFHDKDPIKAALGGIRGFTYRTKLFIISWNSPGALSNLRSNIFYPEISLL